MAGVKTFCRDNTATHRQGCGASYSGNQAHCVARAPWSTHPDGLCHETFASPGIADKHWTKLGHVNPFEVAGLTLDGRGVWHGPPMTPAAVEARRAASLSPKAKTATNPGSDVPVHPEGPR